MEYTRHRTHPAFAGQLTQDHAQLIEKSIAGFLSHQPRSNIHEDYDLHVILGPHFESAEKGQVTVTIDFPPRATTQPVRDLYLQQMMRAVTQRYPADSAMLPHVSEGAAYALDLTFANAQAVITFFNALSRVPLLTLESQRSR